MFSILTRREFLRASALSGAALALESRCPGRGQQLPRTKRVQKIIVIGAGISGLVSAYELMNAGNDVTVLEARTRPGGRIRTIRDDFADKLYAEAGAVDFTECYTLLMHYLDVLNVPTVEVPEFPHSVLYARGTRYVTPPDPVFGRSDEERKLGFAGSWQRYVVDVSAQTGDPHHPVWPEDQARALDKITLKDYLASKGLTPDGVARFMTRIDGNDYDHLSALSTMNIEHFYSKWAKTLSVRGGNDLLPKAFVSKLENRIHFGAAVRALSQSSEKVTVSFRQGNLQQQLEADRVVVTIPFSVLRTIDLGSSVSVQKREAINRLKYESVLRVYVQSKTRFWNQQGIRGDSGTDLPIGIIVDRTSRQPGTRGILEAQMAYQLAETAKKMNRADLVPWTVGEMNKVHPEIVENYEGAVTVSWDDDPYSRGAWAYYAPGDMTNIYPHVATAEGRIHFAGEHTSYLPSTIEGAIHSGIRAAHEINAT